MLLYPWTHMGIIEILNEYSVQILAAQVQISSLVMCVSVSATVALCLLFGPKMYLVRFQFGPKMYLMRFLFGP